MAILAIVMMIRCMKGAIRVPSRGTIRRGVRQPNFGANGGVRSKYMASRVAINEKLPDYRTVLAEMNSVNVNTIVTPSLDNIRRIYDLCGKPLSPVIHVVALMGRDLSVRK